MTDKLPWYNVAGDQIEFTWADEAVVGEWINPYFSLHRSAIDNRIIGFTVEGIRKILEESQFKPATTPEELELLKYLINLIEAPNEQESDNNS